MDAQDIKISVTILTAIAMVIILAVTLCWVSSKYQVSVIKKLTGVELTTAEVFWAAPEVVVTESGVTIK